MKVGYVQLAPKFGMIEENVEKAISFIESADADLLVLPELFNTGYLFLSSEEALELAEPVPDGYTTQKLIEVAEKTKTYIVAGIAERADNKVYNSAVIVGPRGFMGVYRKSHLFYKEKLIFAPGDSGFKVFDLGIAKIGVIICFDWCFPEATRILAIKGADIICHPANLVLPYAPKVMLARSIENRVFTITANRVGTDERGGEKLNFIGLSQVTSPKMEVLIQAGSEEESVGVVEIDVSHARNKWITEYNHVFNDRRIDLYEELLKSPRT
ncbi:MAG: acyltransferase [Candidatus Methanomethylicota archaeon]|uniref:Acyltransferase n=1 Tax=Thermoproteota archaeon TaxID=2056631 RepID=A0A497F408_9CREN|nr:MAG: acyltransferase [Candidatus Verstraetearchaeota archaeon]